MLLSGARGTVTVLRRVGLPERLLGPVLDLGTQLQDRLDLAVVFKERHVIFFLLLNLVYAPLLARGHVLVVSVVPRLLLIPICFLDSIETGHLLIFNLWCGTWPIADPLCHLGSL